MNEKLNFCIPDMMSVCTAKDLKTCKFYQPSTVHDRCMFQSIELLDGWHCGCCEAQKESLNKKELVNSIELIEEGEEGIMST